MPLSKRDKKVSLTKTSKKGMKLKQKLVEEIQKNLQIYSNLYVFTVHNMRNGLLKGLREDWNDSRFFFAKRKVMAIALGRTKTDEVKKNLHKLSAHLIGQCGLLFTDKPKDYVKQWFREFSKVDFAKAGFIATETVTLPAGLLSEFSFSIEPHLRSLGLPTKLEKGKVILREQHIVCMEGNRLTPEQASILKLLGKQMAEFKLTLVCMWSKDGIFKKLKSSKGIENVSEKMLESTHKESEEIENDGISNKFVKVCLDPSSTVVEVKRSKDQVKHSKKKVKQSTYQHKSTTKNLNCVDGNSYDESKASQLQNEVEDFEMT